MQTTKKELKILIIGEAASTNLGDQLIVENITKRLTECVPNAKLKVVPFLKCDSFYERCIRYIIRKINSEYAQKFTYTIFNFRLLLSKKYDIILFPGGELFLPYFLGYLRIVINYAEKNKKKVFFNSIGIGKMTEEEKDYLLSLLSSETVRYISLRDGYKYWGDDFKAYHTFDSVLVMNNYVEKKDNLLGIGIINSSLIQNYCGIDANNFEDRLVEFIKIQKQHRKIGLFTSGDQGDNAFLMELLTKYESLSDVAVFIPYSTDEFKKMFSYYECVVSFRMHSLIMAYISNIPIYGIAWDDKVNHLFSVIDENDKVYSLYDFLKNVSMNIETYEVKSSRQEQIRDKINYDFGNMIKIIEEEN